MSISKPSTTLPLPGGRHLGADETERHLSLMLEGAPLIRLRLERGPQLHVHLQEANDRPVGPALWAACYWLFARDPDCQQLVWHLDERPGEALLSGLLAGTPEVNEYVCERVLFWQLPQPWLGKHSMAVIRSK